MKKTRKLIAIVLTVLTIFSVTSVATPVLAAEVTEEELSEQTETNSAEMTLSEESSESDKPKTLNEMVEWRTESTKYFRNSDGSYTAAQYAHPVHYKENGVWKEIDNTLSEETLDKGLISREKEFVADKTNTPAKFPDSFNEEGSKRITVATEGYEISFSPKATELKNATGDIKEREELNSVKIIEDIEEKAFSTLKLTADSKVEKLDGLKEEEIFKLENKSGAIVYENVFNNVDLEYELNNSKIKESIVLNQKQDNYVFSFNMDLGGLEPVICEDGSINLCTDKEGKNPIAKIEAPYMVDSLGAYSEAVSMSIKQNGEEYILTVNADESWLNSKERKFPVVIDPTIDLQISRLNTIDCYVDNSQPSTPFPTDYYMYAGYSSLGKTRTFIKFNLPQLPDDNCIITNAYINFWQKSADTSSTAGYFTIHEVTANWNNTSSSLKPTWNSQPSYNGKVLDYAQIKAGENISYKFDITRTVKEWYEAENLDDNYGFMLKSQNESVVNRVQLYSAENSADGAYPAIYVTFRNNKGLEGYWSYSSFGVGSAGTVHVNDYSGNLVYELPLASSISEIMPVSIVGYYNNYCANELIRETEATNVRTSIGRGFRLNYQQTLLPSTKYGLSGTNAQKYPYVYTDADGTEHYIQKVTENGSTVYKDEDGLGLTLSTSFDEEGTYRITDKLQNKYYFNVRGNLFKIINNNGNEINIKYKAASSDGDLLNKSRIDKIIDGAGHTFQFGYEVNNTTGIEKDYVKTITDDAGRVVRFSFSNGLLIKVSYPDGDFANIDYEIIDGDTSEGRINAIISNDSYELNIDYNSKKLGRLAKTVKEYGITKNTDGTYSHSKGQVITFDRTQFNTTIMRSCGMDGIHYADNNEKGNDDIITTVQYDNMGRAVSQQMKYGSGKGISAGSVNYTSADDDKSTSGFKNKIGSNAAIDKSVVNLLMGGNCDSTSSWGYATMGTITASGATSSAYQYIGKSSLKLAATSIGTENARCYFRQFIYDANVGSDYTLSAYVKTTGMTKFSDADLTGAFLELDAYNADGALLQSTTSQILSSNTDTSANKGWRRLSTTITVPENTATLRSYIVLRNASGTAYFDCIQLEKSSAANSYNMLENSNFEKYSSATSITSWSGVSSMYEASTDDGISTDSKHNGSYSVKINGILSASKGISQTVTVQPNPEDTYIVGGWARGYPINSTFHISGSGQDATETALFEISVRVTYTKTDANGNTSTVTQYKDSAKFNTTITAWQYATIPFVLKYTGGEEGCTYTPTAVRIMPRYNKQENFVYFDHLMLVKDVSSSYTYDKDGNLVSAASNGEQKSNMQYDDNNNLTSYTDTAGYKTTASYDNKNNLTLSKSAKGVYSGYEYSSQGNATSSEIRNNSNSSSATAVIKTTASYSGAKTVDGVTIKAGAYLEKAFDENGNATTYTRDTKSGELLSVKNANNVLTSYEYNGTFGKPESVSSAGSKVTYNYNTKKQLDNIVFGTTKNEKYSFEYDVFGNVVKTKVGSQALSTNTYKPNNGALYLTTYGNDYTKRFTYNNLGQKIGVYGDTPTTAQRLLYSWSYNDSGSAASHIDHVNGLKYIADYDSLGRLSKEEVQNNADSSYIGSVEYGYDIRNNLNALVTTFGGDTRYQYYYYSEHAKGPNSAKYAKDNLPTVYQLYYNSRYAIYDYDSLNRLTQREFTLEEPLYYNYTYKTSGRNSGTSTKYTTSQIQEEYIGNDVYIYGYDVLGNITSIKKANRTTAGSNATTHGTATDYTSYTYDNLGQLTRENLAGNKTTVWDYDELGNISSKSEYAYTTGTLGTATKTVKYAYTNDGKSGWNNLLTAVDFNGNSTTEANETITYDNIGNPTTYFGSTLAWNGRQLKSYNATDKNISYTYNADGLRATKTYNGVTTKYFYVNGQLHYEERSDGTQLHFYYDSYGYLSCIKYNGGNYFVATNKRGDVVALYYPGGKIMGRYEYDAWGNITKITDYSYDAAGNLTTTDLTNNPNSRDLLVVNPIRYRSYYYDVETGFYYLQSRYYNPEIGRFLNADGYITTGQGVLSYNMFAYCGNNPVMYSDPSGCLPQWAKKIISKTIDIVIKVMKKSKIPVIKIAGEFLGAAKKGYDKGQDITSIENPLTKTNEIKEQYINDIENVGGNNALLTETPSLIIFNDITEYNIRCQEKWNMLTYDPRYSDVSGTSFDKIEAKNTIISWDYATCFDLCGYTVVVTFTETMVSIMDKLYT